jgi:MATE family multidrug resistance protein
VATAIIAWTSALVGFGMLAWDRTYRPFALFASLRPSWPALRELLRLGLPIGAAYVVDVTAFTFMSLFVARFGATVGASHQITSNVVVVLFMVALAIANATSVLVAQSVGAGDHRRARRTVLGGGLWLLRAPVAGLYTTDPAVLAAAMPLMAIAAGYHLFDAMQAFLVNVLRAYKIVTLPTLVYVFSLWGVGLAGGWWLTFAGPAQGPLSALAGERGGATGFWIAAACSVAAASVGMAVLLARLWRSPAARPELGVPGDTGR